MRILLLLLTLLLLPLPGAAMEGYREEPTAEDIESQYVLAKAILEDPSQRNMNMVPEMLLACAQHRHSRAARLLLDVYQGRFKGLEADPTAAYEHAKHIAEAEMLPSDDEDARELQRVAIYRLATFQATGYGCKKDEAAAFRTMEKAADQGIPEAQVELARMLMNGSGTQKDNSRAWKLLHQVAQTAPDTPHVFFYMGCMTYARSNTKAARLFYYGVRHKDPECMNNLAAIYESGRGRPKNAAEALRLYRMAAALGNKKASANMQRLAYKRGISISRAPGNSDRERIRNAVTRVIRTLPINKDSQKRLQLLLEGKRYRATH